MMGTSHSCEGYSSGRTPKFQSPGVWLIFRPMRPTTREHGCLKNASDFLPALTLTALIVKKNPRLAMKIALA